MARFSERYGYRKLKDVIQKESMDDDLRNSIWNALKLYIFDCYRDYDRRANEEAIQSITKSLWINLYKQPLDTLSYSRDGVYLQFQNLFSSFKWDDIYDLIEHIANNFEIKECRKEFIKTCNIILERELSGYRFIDGLITPITNDIEISEIDEALKLKNPFKSVSRHLLKGLEHLSDRKNPDYSNSIKESISAIEAICKLITGDERTTLGKALTKIGKEQKIQLHESLNKAFKHLYWFTSDAEGIRHALLDDESNLGFEDAKFMLVSCSAFVNYLKEKVRKANIKIRTTPD